MVNTTIYYCNSRGKSRGGLDINKRGAIGTKSAKNVLRKSAFRLFPYMKHIRHSMDFLLEKKKRKTLHCHLKALEYKSPNLDGCKWQGKRGDE